MSERYCRRWSASDFCAGSHNGSSSERSPGNSIKKVRSIPLDGAFPVFDVDFVTNPSYSALWRLSLAVQAGLIGLASLSLLWEVGIDIARLQTLMIRGGVNVINNALLSFEYQYPEGLFGNDFIQISIFDGGHEINYLLRTIIYQAPPVIPFQQNLASSIPDF